MWHCHTFCFFELKNFSIDKFTPYIYNTLSVRWGEIVRIDLTNFFNENEKSISVDYTLNLNELEYGTYKPIQNGAKVAGEISQNAGVVLLDVVVSFQFNGFCDRCAEPVKKNMKLNLHRVLVKALANEEDADSDEFDDYIVVENAQLDLDDLIEEEVLLFLPSKILCKNSCKGLCPTCGKNLNLGPCDCEKEVDPRMAGLLDLLNSGALDGQ